MEEDVFIGPKAVENGNETKKAPEAREKLKRPENIEFARLAFLAANDMPVPFFSDEAESEFDKKVKSYCENLDDSLHMSKAEVSEYLRINRKLHWVAGRLDEDEKYFYEQTKERFSKFLEAEFPRGDIGILDKIEPIDLDKTRSVAEPVSLMANDMLAAIPDRKVVPTEGFHVVEVNFKDLKGMEGVDQKLLDNFFEYTRLENMRMRIFVWRDDLKNEDWSLSDHINNSIGKAKFYMGWDSCMETAEDFPGKLLLEEKEAVVVTFDAPGQFQSNYKDPSEVREDRFLTSVQQYNMAVQLAERVLGIDDNKFDEENKAIVKFGHSRGGATVMNEGRWDKDNTAIVATAPVFGHSKLRDKLYGDWLPRSLRLMSSLKLDETQAGKALVGRVVKKLISDNNERLNSLHNYVFQETDAELTAQYIDQLMKQSIPYVEDRVLDASRHRITVFKDDMFTNFDAMKKAIYEKMRMVEDKFKQIVDVRAEGHYGFSTGQKGKGDYEKRVDTRNGLLGFMVNHFDNHRKKIQKTQPLS